MNHAYQPRVMAPRFLLRGLAVMPGPVRFRPASKRWISWINAAIANAHLACARFGWTRILPCRPQFGDMPDMAEFLVLYPDGRVGPEIVLCLQSLAGGRIRRGWMGMTVGFRTGRQLVPENIVKHLFTKDKNCAMHRWSGRAASRAQRWVLSLQREGESLRIGVVSAGCRRGWGSLSEGNTHEGEFMK